MSRLEDYVTHQSAACAREKGCVCGLDKLQRKTTEFTVKSGAMTTRWLHQDDPAAIPIGVSSYIDRLTPTGRLEVGQKVRITVEIDDA